MSEADNQPAEQQEVDLEGDVLGRALDELAALVNPHTSHTKLYIEIYYLLLLWASLRVYQLEPYVESGSDDEHAEVIPLANGWKIFDYGYYLVTSPGENYGTYCTGKLIETTQHMIDILAKRGVTRVGLLGNGVARRAAWMECEDIGIEVNNYYPTESDKQLLQKIKKFREEAKQRRAMAAEEKRRPV